MTQVIGKSRALVKVLLFILSGAAASLSVAAADLMEMDLDELAEVTLTSVSKRTQALSATPAAVYVITAGDIANATTTLLPELLRQVPGLQVARVNAHTWAISARGFNSAAADKLEVTLDGRTLYTPLYSGVFWDQQMIPLDQIERIEVMRGAAGTLWGSNAVNGVINIVSKRAANSSGLALSAGEGDGARALREVRWGGLALGGGLRANYMAQTHNSSLAVSQTGAAVDATDGWDHSRAGLRGDWGDWSLIGDYSEGREQGEAADIDFGGSSVSLVRSVAETGGGHTEFQFYREQTHRRVERGFEESRRTTQLRYERNVLFGESHDVVWGMSYRRSADETGGSQSLIFTPANRTIGLSEAFAQDQWRWSTRNSLLYGAKIEHNDFTGIEWQPSLRWLWANPGGATAWAAVSRAVRTPNRLDHDARLVGASNRDPESAAEDFDGGAAGELPTPPVQATEESCVASGGAPAACALLYDNGVASANRPRTYEECRAQGLGPRTCGALFTQNLVRDLVGSRNFRSEELIAYEFGWRDMLTPALGLDLALFYNDYSELRGIHTESDGTATISNELTGTSLGGELAANWQPSPQQKWNLGYSYLRLDLRPNAGSNDTRSEQREGNDPRHQAFVRLQWSPQTSLSSTLALRYVGALPNQRIPSYTELDAGLAWQIRRGISLRLTGENLLRAHHTEFGSDLPNAIERSALLTLKLGG